MIARASACGGNVVLGGARVRVQYLVLEPGVLDAQLLLVEGHLAEDGRAAAAGADDVANGCLQPEVVVLQALVLRPQHHVVRPVLLSLQRAAVTIPCISVSFLPQRIASNSCIIVGTDA